MKKLIILILLLIGCFTKNDIEGKYSIGNYDLEISNVNDEGFDFQVDGVSATGGLCLMGGNASFINDKNLALYKDTHPDLDVVGIKGNEECIYTFKINDDSIEISVNDNRCARLYCGSSAWFILKYDKMDE